MDQLGGKGEISGGVSSESHVAGTLGCLGLVHEVPKALEEPFQITFL